MAKHQFNTKAGIDPLRAPKTTPADAACAGGSFATDEARWQAIATRNPKADGHFLFAVRTTGIYCWPSCRSRPALRHNVEYFDTAAQAAAVGYRPCKRCKPDTACQPDPRVAIAARAAAIIAASPDAHPLAALAEAVGLSPSHFHRLFKSVMGVTPKDYRDAVCAERLRAGLDGSQTITTAIHDAGYGAVSRYYENASDRLGMTATAYRHRGEGADIRFAVSRCCLGAILVAATDRGICSISLGDEPEDLVTALKLRFANAERVGNNPAFDALVADVIGAIAEPAQAIALPLDVRGTAFQERVWQALRSIPFGQTATYTDIARRIGQPNATRAVANACGANPAAVAIPCHRVVRNDGSLGGYRWGIARKRTLLAREQSQTSTGPPSVQPKTKR